MPISQPEFDRARAYAVQRLRTQLSPVFCYHCLAHTCEDVLPAAERLAQLENISPLDRLLIRTAVLYHDIGFTVQPENHESISAEVVQMMLPRFGYSPAQIGVIRDLILVTKLFTPPQNRLEGIIVDADLDVLGREDFFTRNQDLRRENALQGKYFSDQQWYSQQLKFLQLHQYRTASALVLRSDGKQKNIQLLMRLLSQNGAHKSVAVHKDQPA